MFDSTFKIAHITRNTLGVEENPHIEIAYAGLADLHKGSNI